MPTEEQMSGISRREFIRNAAAGAAAGFLSAGALKLRGNPLGLPIGCQTWPVRKMIAQDFPGTLKQLSAAGFQAIELCSPVRDLSARARTSAWKSFGPTRPT